MDHGTYSRLKQNDYRSNYILHFEVGGEDMADNLHHKKQSSLESRMKFWDWSAGLLTFGVYVYLLVTHSDNEVYEFLLIALVWYFFGWKVVKNRWNIESDKIQYRLAWGEYLDAIEKGQTD